MNDRESSENDGSCNERERVLTTRREATVTWTVTVTVNGDAHCHISRNIVDGNNYANW